MNYKDTETLICNISAIGLCIFVDMNLTYTHGLESHIAIEKLKTFATALTEKHAKKVKVVSEVWEGNTLKFRLKVKTPIPGIEPELTGWMQVEDKVMEIEAPLPSFAKSFEPEVSRIIQETLDQLFIA